MKQDAKGCEGDGRHEEHREVVSLAREGAAVRAFEAHHRTFTGQRTSTRPRTAAANTISRTMEPIRVL